MSARPRTIAEIVRAILDEVRAAAAEGRRVPVGLLVEEMAARHCFNVDDLAVHVLEALRAERDTSALTTTRRGRLH